MKVLLTGASGYIGGNLLEQLKDDYEIVAASRSTDNKEDEKNVTWKKVDLYALEDIEAAMGKACIRLFISYTL